MACCKSRFLVWRKSSTDTLGKIESRYKNISVDTLWRIAEALDLMCYSIDILIMHLCLVIKALELNSWVFMERIT